MSKHTPGPWSFDEGSEDVLVEALSKDRKRVVREICHVLDDGEDAETKANLRLIALAPELFEVLEGIVVNSDQYDVVDESWWEAARELIKKVRAPLPRRKAVRR